MDRLLDAIPELENRLLLYAAGELPADEAAVVERELADDAGVREALEQLRALLSEVDSHLALVKATESVPPRCARRATDRAVRSVFGWVEVGREAQALRSSSGHLLAEGMVWRYARWPLAAAAVLVVGLMIWTFGTQPAQDQGAVAGLTPQQSPVDASAPGNDDAGDGGLRAPETQLEQMAALFDSPGTDGSDPLTAGLSEELVALRLLEEPDYE